MTTPEQLIDDSLYLIPGEQVQPLVWRVLFRARVCEPLKVTPYPPGNEKPAKTSDGRYAWQPQEPALLIGKNGRPLGPINHRRLIGNIPFVLTTKSPDAAKTGRALKRKRTA